MKVSIALLLAGSISPSLGAAPSQDWVVVAAPRYGVVSNMQALYESDDPQLVGRIATFDGKGVTFDGYPIKCAKPMMVTGVLPAGRLFRAMFPDRTTYGKLHVARPTSFGLRVSPATRLSVTRLRCAAGRGPDPYYYAAALFTLPDRRQVLWLNEIDDHLLFLKPTSGSIRASFDCGKARSPSERAICGDRNLAGWDRTVAQVFNDRGDLEEQRTWLIERDACGADKACLQESMSRRARNLLR